MNDVYFMTGYINYNSCLLFDERLKCHALIPKIDWRSTLPRYLHTVIREVEPYKLYTTLIYYGF